MKIFKKKIIIVFICLVVILVGCILVSLCLGTINISVSNIINFLLGNDKFDLHQTFFYIRLPRIIMAMLTGAALSVSGCVFQSILKNPLADPFTLGISAGAALGAAIAFLSDIFTIASIFVVPMFSLFGVLISVFIVYMLSYYKDFDPNSMVLSGVVVSYIFSSLVMLLYILAPSENVYTAVMWLMGNLSYVDIKALPIISIFIFIGIVFLTFCGNTLNLISLGGEKPQTLGINITRATKILFIVASAITAITVSFCGIIGFVGLMVPHTMKRIVGSNNTILIPASALGGAVFLLACDTISRVIVLPVQLPVGVVTSIIGGIFFIILLLGVKRKYND